MNHAFVFALGILHVGFLIAISIRLSHLGFQGKTIFRIIAFSIGIWPIVLLIGALTDLVFLWGWAGLPPTIALTLVLYLCLEFMVSTESDNAKAERIKLQEEEKVVHQQQVEADEKVLQSMIPIKTYVGEDQNLLAISDLGKLKESKIRCRIEGSVVRTLMIKEADIDRVASIIEIPSSEEQSN